MPTISCGLLAFSTLLFSAPHVAAGADLSKDIRTASDLSIYKSEISQYVAGQVALLSQDDDAKKASTARDSLVDEVRGLVDPSPQFLDAYCDELQRSLAPATTNPSVRVRLNAAIVVATVAAKTQSAQLAPLVVTELNDTSDAVIIWALKAAHEVIPPALSVPNLKVQLLTAVNKAAQRLGSGPVIAAAYNALTGGDKPPAASGELVLPVQTLLAWRIRQYATAPPEPPADARATEFLTERNVWLKQTTAQQRYTVQLIIDLMTAASADLTAAQADDKTMLILLLRRCGEAIYVIGITTGDQSLMAASTPLTHVDSKPPPLPPLAAVAAAIKGISTNVKFAGLRIPPAFSNSTTAPPSSAAAPPKTAP